MPNDSERLLSAKEVAALLGLSRGTVYRLVHAGELAAPIQVGGRSRWKREDVERITRKPRRLRAPKRAGEAKAG
jgi:excisionase family DNA binding protein